MRHLDLFSGIGGFALAAQWVWGAEHEIVSFCDNDKAAQVVLSKHWPGVPIHDDIKTLDATKWRGTVDLVTGGFPCQPFSCAGKRGGAADDRYLWPEMLRVIDECKPRWVLGENVPGIIGMELDRVLFDLERAGYEARPLVIPACAVDAPHRRARVWIVGYASGESIGGVKGLRNGVGQEAASEWEADYNELDGSGANVAHTCGERRQQNARSSYGDEGANEGRPTQYDNELAGSREAVADAASAERERGRRTRSRREGFANVCQWPSEPALGRVAYGVPYRVDRLRLLGNSIVSAVACEIFKAMKAVNE